MIHGFAPALSLRHCAPQAFACRASNVWEWAQYHALGVGLAVGAAVALAWALAERGGK